MEHSYSNLNKVKTTQAVRWLTPWMPVPFASVLYHLNNAKEVGLCQSGSRVNGDRNMPTPLGFLVAAQACRTSGEVL
jgi:hypothetical protein